MSDQDKVFEAIRKNPGRYTSAIVAMLDIPRNRVEDAIWELWARGDIQMENDSTLRVTREGESVFRHFAP